MESPIKAGELNTLVHIEQGVRSKGSRGEIITEWSPLTKAWAKVEQGLFSEGSEAYGRTGEQGVRVSIRYRKNIDTTMRLKIEDEYYYIQAKGVEGKKQFTIIEATLKNG